MYAHVACYICMHMHMYMHMHMHMHMRMCMYAHVDMLHADMHMHVSQHAHDMCMHMLSGITTDSTLSTFFSPFLYTGCI
jgi:hypothetical protein